MKFIAYILTLGLLRLLSLLPNFLLYGISELFGWLLQYVLRYRRKVVNKNLHNSFPEADSVFFRKTKRKFYRHLADVILENAAMLFYSKKKLGKMFCFADKTLMEKYEKEQRHIIIMTAHYNNWEWSSPLAYEFSNPLLAVYAPLRNPYFEKAYRKTRAKYGAIPVAMAKVGREIFSYHQNNTPCTTGMVGDQRPIRKHVKYWTNFLNQQTAVFTGSETLAKKIDAVVVFMKIEKHKRGRYFASFELITDRAKETAEHEITNSYTQKLEQQIVEQPSYWLWSHDRWKISYDRWKDLQITQG
jgi:KDO2-lipid IV(A) lauroyltransferase